MTIIINSNLGNQVSDLKKTIKGIENKSRLNDYILNTAFIMEKYYNIKDNNNIGDIDSVINEYNRITGSNIIKLQSYTKYNICSNCNSTDIFKDSESYVCIDCGVVNSTFLEQADLSYKELQERDYQSTFAYKRINHFKEWLNQIQAKENTSIPDNVITTLKEEIVKERIEDLSMLNKELIKKYLKKHKLNKYCEHAQHLVSVLNGITPLQMSEDLEQTLINMFTTIQEPFEKHKPAKRKNFLHYGYVLYKFCELLGKDEYLQYFTLLKNREKLYEHDIVWSKICEELNYQFIKTV